MFRPPSDFPACPQLCPDYSPTCAGLVVSFGMRATAVCACRWEAPVLTEPFTERSAGRTQCSLAGISVPALNAVQKIQQKCVYPLPADTIGLFVCLRSPNVAGTGDSGTCCPLCRASSQSAQSTRCDSHLTWCAALSSRHRLGSPLDANPAAHRSRGLLRPRAGQAKNTTVFVSCAELVHSLSRRPVELVEGLSCATLPIAPARHRPPRPPPVSPKPREPTVGACASRTSS